MSAPPAFPSKILLFGEYSVITDPDARALCIAYPFFGGSLGFKRNGRGPDPELRAFASFLRFLGGSGGLPAEMDLGALDFDIAQGLSFDSTIPMGFGVGSSGALTAAIYDRYAEGGPGGGRGGRGGRGARGDADIPALRRALAALESHFHGSSSGIDPLVSYLGRSVLVRDGGDPVPVDVPDPGGRRGGVFLVNTGRPRRTEPLVNLFLEKRGSRDFRRRCRDELLPATHDCIDRFLASDREGLEAGFHALSLFQYEHLAPMIPPLFRSLWRRGLEGGDYRLKLCGAGGGGFLLGLARDFRGLEELLGRHEVRRVAGV